MRINGPLDAISAAIGNAIHLDLPDIQFKTRDYENTKKQGVDVFIDSTRRPTNYDISVKMSIQSWSDTSCGFGGLAGQAFTDSYVVLIEDNQMNFCLYIANRLAFKENYMNINQAKFLEDFILGKMPNARNMRKKYLL